MKGLDISSHPLCGLKEAVSAIPGNKSYNHLHIHHPFGGTIICVRRGQWSDVVGLSVVIPGDYLNEPWPEIQNLLPSVIPEKI